MSKLSVRAFALAKTFTRSHATGCEATRTINTNPNVADKAIEQPSSSPAWTMVPPSSSSEKLTEKWRQAVQVISYFARDQLGLIALFAECVFHHHLSGVSQVKTCFDVKNTFDMRETFTREPF